MSAPVRSFVRTHAIALVILLVGAGAIGAYTIFARDSRDILNLCAASQNKPVCYSNAIEEILRLRGVPEAFDALAFVYDNDPDFAGTCHALTHDLGKAAYEEYHKTGHTELTSKGSYCGYGYYHGFLDQLTIDTNDLGEARAFCTYVGENVPHPPPPAFAEGSCYHGIGHGITDGTDPRLWGDAVRVAKPGLALCAKVADGNEAWQMRCVSGVFNAIGNMYPNPKYKLASDPDPYALCKEKSFTPLETETCYNQMNTQAAALGHNNLAEIIEFTNRIPNQHYRSVALNEAVSYFVQILKHRKQQLSTYEMSLCDLPTDELKSSCAEGLVGGVYEFGLPGEQYKEAVAVCDDTSLSSDLRRPCYNALVRLARDYYDPKIARSLCSNIPREYQSACDSRGV